jgi:hypothetical protein
MDRNLTGLLPGHLVLPQSRTLLLQGREASLLYDGLHIVNFGKRLKHPAVPIHPDTSGHTQAGNMRAGVFSKPGAFVSSPTVWAP